MKYKGIKNIESAPNVVKAIKPKNLKFLSTIFLCILTFACLNISVFNAFDVSGFIKRITLNWTPKPEDMGKIKFVNFSFNNKGDKEDGIFIVSSPFKSYFVNNITPTLLEVNGLGDPVVISPISGVVQTIKTEKGKCDISITSGNVIVNLKGLDYACTSVGTKVQTGTKIGVSLNSKISFSIVCDGEYISLPASGLEGTFFE